MRPLFLTCLVAACAVALNSAPTHAAPVLTTFTNDADTNGSIDRIRLAASDCSWEDFGDVNKISVVDSVSGHNFKVMSIVSGPDAAQLYINIEESGQPDTGVLPTVTIEAGTFMCGGASVPGTDEMLTPSDEAGIVLMRAERAGSDDSGGNQDRGLYIQLSEAPNAMPMAGDFTYTDVSVGGWDSIIDVEAISGVGNAFRLIANTVFTATDSMDTIALMPANILDSAMNVASDTAVNFSPTANVAFESVTGVDTNGDGIVNRLVVRFDHPVRDVQFGESSFASRFTSTTPGVTVDSVVTGLSANDNEIWINLANTATDPDTAASVSITSTDGTFSINVQPSSLTSPIASADGMAPILVSATSTGGNTDVVLTFSEPVTTAVTMGHVTYTAADNAAISGFTTTTVDSVSDGDGSDSSVSLTMSRALDVFNFVDTDDDTLLPGDTIAMAMSVSDGDGNALDLLSPANTKQLTNTAAASVPTVTSATTVAASGGPVVGAVAVTFSEAMDAALLDIAANRNQFMIAGYTLDGTHTVDGANVEFGVTSAMAADGGATPSVTYSAAATTILASAAGVRLRDGVSVTAADGIPMEIDSMWVSDENGDGIVDRLTVAFTEDALAASADAADWAVEGFSVDSIDTSDADMWTFALAADSATPNTGLTPAVTVAAAAIQDANNVASNLQGGDAEDRADAVLLSVIAAVGQTDLELTFSEGVFGTAGASGAVTDAASFAYTGSQSVASVANTAGEAAVVLTLDSVVTVDDFSNTVSVAGGGQVFDAAGRTASTATGPMLSNPDTTPPELVSAETQDRDSNGHIDTIVLTFSENLADNTVRLADFVAGDEYNVTAAGSGDTINDAVLELTLEEMSAFDTGATPLVSIVAASTLTDAAGVGLAGGASVTPTDGAAPIITQAGGVSGGRRFLVTFSEPVVHSPGDSELQVEDFVYNDVAGSGASAFESIEEADGRDEQVILLVNENLTPADIGEVENTPADSVSAAEGAIVDVVGNTVASGTAATITRQNAVAGSGSKESIPAYGWALIAAAALLLIVATAGITYRISKKRAAERAAAEKGIPMTAEEVLAKHDKDGDGVLDRDEIAELIEESRRPKDTAGGAGAAAAVGAAGGAAADGAGEGDEVDIDLENGDSGTDERPAADAGVEEDEPID